MNKCLWCDVVVDPEEPGIKVSEWHLHAWCARSLVVDTVKALKQEIANESKGARS